MNVFNLMADEPSSTPPAPDAPPPQPGATQPLPGYVPPQVAMPPGYVYPAYPQPGAYPPGYAPMPGYQTAPMMPPGYAAPGYPPGYPMPYPGQPYPPGQMPVMPPGYPMPHPAMTSPLPAPVPAPPPPAQTPAPAPAPAPAVVPAPVAAVPVVSVAPATVPPPAVQVVPATTAVPLTGGDAAMQAENQLFGEDGLPHPFHPEAAHDFGPEPRRNAFVEMWKKIGGGSLSLSIAIHVGVLVIAGLIVFTTSKTIKNVDFLPGGGTQQGAQASQDMQHKVQQKRRSTIAKTTPIKKVVSTSQSASISLPDAPPDLLDVPDVSSMLGGGSLGSGGFGKGGAGGGFGNGIGMGSQAGFVSLPPSMRARCSTQERLQKLAQNGGSSECEAAVSRALEWLKTKQNKDGSWGQQNKAAMTGLALLCFLGRCETPESPFYGDNVMRGIMYLIELSKKNPKGFITEDFGSNGGAYEHGIATYALGEMYTLARLGSKSLPGMKDAFEKGVKLIIDHQNETGGWDYYVKNDQDGRPTSSRNDLSVTGWQYQALKAAHHTGLKINGLQTAITKTIKYIEATQTKDGGIGTLNRDAPYNQWNLTGTGVLGLQTLGKGGKKSVIDKGMKFLRSFISAEPLDWNKNCNLYCWYYYTQAFFQQGGDDWKFYNEMLLPQILNNQKPDGSWKPERPNSQVAAVGEREGGVYKTTLCVLQLEVYYRYLKVADREEGSIFDR